MTVDLPKLAVGLAAEHSEFAAEPATEAATATPFVVILKLLLQRFSW